MKIAVASTDGASISQHFGRSRCFIVFDVTDGEIIGRAVRDNTFTAHAKGECDGEDHGHDQPHSHADIVAALEDCRIVLSGGMGRQAAAELQANAIQPALVDPALTPEQAVRHCLDGTLAVKSSFCRCHE